QPRWGKPGRHCGSDPSTRVFPGDDDWTAGEQTSGASISRSVGTVSRRSGGIAPFLLRLLVAAALAREAVAASGSGSQPSVRTYASSPSTGSSPGYSQCPSHAEISPCTCSIKKNGLDLVCEFTDALRISKAMGALKGKQGIVLYYLKLRHNSLPKLQAFVFLGLDIRHLTIHNSSLAVVEEAALSSVGRALTQLDLSQNALSSVPSPALRSLHSLLILNLNHNRISVLRTGAFMGLDTLEILTLYENKITLVEQGAFKGPDKKLKRLNLGGNDLSSVPTDALSTLDSLRKLEIQENKISEIKEGDFAGLKGLDSLGLAHNRLREIPARAFSELTLLNSLEMEGNHIYHIHPEAFKGLEDLGIKYEPFLSTENLQYLRLGDNKLHAIPSEALRRLHRLRTLDLRGNNITSVPEDAFNGFGDTITFLNLQKNGIKSLPILAFENLNSLETLSLQNNKLQHLPEEVMEPVVDTLKVIDLMGLRDKDDEMMQKKRTVCMIQREHREYSLRELPLEKMECATSSSSSSSSPSSSSSSSSASTAGHLLFYYFTFQATPFPSPSLSLPLFVILTQGVRHA
ncbi:hypothetical protein J437_LFUL005473, partial [Ladona fulva]